MGVSKLIGTEYLKAHMHGYWMDMRFYNKLRAIAEPFEFEEYRKSKIKERIEKERNTRISVKKNMPTVNVKTAMRLAQDDKNKNNLLSDSRFKEMFQNPDFEINEEDEKYQSHRAYLQNVTISIILVD